ncbi:MAG: PKD domain-containing protein, partial [Caldilineaceae bacterium]|nr:PKD domain-containing protein [Caldilineaceae bacterium]
SSSPTILNSSTAFTATITTGTNVTYQWNFGDNSALGSGANTSHTYAAVGTYTAIVTATNNLGSASKSVVVTVRDVPITGLQAANSSPKPVGSAVSFTATIGGGTGVSYTWNFGDGNGGSGATAQHTYASAGTYTAIVTATNTSGSRAVPTVVTVQGLVTLTVQTVGDGTVAKAPNATQYVLGTIVKLTATPDAGQRFVGWSGDASGTTNPLNVAMDNNKTIVATFEEIPIYTTFVYMPYVRNSEPTIPLYLPTIRALSR